MSIDGCATVVLVVLVDDVPDVPVVVPVVAPVLVVPVVVVGIFLVPATIDDDVALATTGVVAMTIAIVRALIFIDFFIVSPLCQCFSWLVFRIIKWVKFAVLRQIVCDFIGTNWQLIAIKIFVPKNGAHILIA